MEEVWWFRFGIGPAAVRLHRKHFVRKLEALTHAASYQEASDSDVGGLLRVTSRLYSELELTLIRPRRNRVRANKYTENHRGTRRG